MYNFAQSHMLPPMKIDQSGLDFIAAREGLRQVAFWDVTGWACGYGHHGPDIDAHTTCNLEIAKNWLASDADTLSYQLSNLIKPALTQRQFNAMGSFSYNIGIGAFASSTLLERLNGGDFTSVPDQLRRWVYSNHQVNRGLQARREYEIALWNGQS